MYAPVGAFVEEVAPQRVLLPADVRNLLVLLVASVMLHAWIVGHTCTTARDSIRFARTALNLEHPAPRSFAEVLRDAKECPDPPGFPLAVLGTSEIVREIHAAPLPEQMLLSAQIASSLAAILLVLPSYWLGRILFRNTFAGIAGALLFQVLPTVAQITSDGLSDSSSLLCVITALVCAVRAVRTQSTKWFLATGLASGCGYLVRPEGLIAVPALGAVVVLLVVRVWPVRTALGRLAALMAGFAIVAAPYMFLIGGVSNKPSVNEPLKKLLPARMLMGTSQKPPVLLLAEWYNGQGSQTLWALKAIAKETIKTSHYATFLLGAVGLFTLRKKLDAAYVVVLTAGILQATLLFALAMKPMPANLGPGSDAVPPYISERHTLLLVYFACLFTGGLLARCTRYGVIVLIVLVAASLPGALKPLHENRAGHYHAGKFLAGKVEANHALIDPFEWAQWYSGRSLHGVPPDPLEKDLTVRWVVWEPTAGTKQNPHSRLPRLEVARNVLQDGANPPKLVYQWPAECPPENAKVVVYQQIVK